MESPLHRQCRRKIKPFVFWLFTDTLMYGESSMKVRDTRMSGRVPVSLPPPPSYPHLHTHTLTHNTHTHTHTQVVGEAGWSFHRELPLDKLYISIPSDPGDLTDNVGLPNMEVPAPSI